MQTYYLKLFNKYKFAYDKKKSEVACK